MVDPKRDGFCLNAPEHWIRTARGYWFPELAGFDPLHCTGRSGVGLPSASWLSDRAIEESSAWDRHIGAP